MRLKDFCDASDKRLLIVIERLNGTHFAFYYDRYDHYGFETNLHGYEDSVVIESAIYDKEIMVWCYQEEEK